MAVLLLESLVLRGVAVLRDGPGVGLRLEAGRKTMPEAPTVAFSMRRLSFPRRGFNPPAGRHAYVGCVANGAGRSQGRMDVDSRRSAARNAARVIQSGWLPINGGSQPTAAACRFPMRAVFAASVGQDTSGYLPTGHARSLPDTSLRGGVAVGTEQALVRRTWCKPAGRIPPASTQGKGDR